MIIFLRSLSVDIHSLRLPEAVCGGKSIGGGWAWGGLEPSSSLFFCVKKGWFVDSLAK
jgi:hypothetical protein